MKPSRKASIGVGALLLLSLSFAVTLAGCSNDSAEGPTLSDEEKLKKGQEARDAYMGGMGKTGSAANPAAGK